MTMTRKGFRHARSQPLAFDPEPKVKTNVGRIHADMWDAQGGCCFYCQTTMVHACARNKRFLVWKVVSRDHFVPRSYGCGLVGNMVLACRRCNNRAHHELPTDEEVARFVALYAKLGRSPDYMLNKLREARVHISSLAEATDDEEKSDTRNHEHAGA